MSRLVTVSPKGRLDVLAFRLAERGAQRLMPREWPLFAPHVERWATKRLGPQALGDLTWFDFLAASNPGTIWTLNVPTERKKDLLSVVLQTIGLQDTPSLPKPSSPVSQGPAAPLTAEKLLSWSPADLAEVEAQKGAQYERDINWFKTWGTGGNSSGSNPSAPKIPPSDADKDNTLLWVAVAVAGALGLVLVIRR